MKWFGQNWGAPVCDSENQVPVPEKNCGLCDDPVLPHHCGFVVPFFGSPANAAEMAAHLECFKRWVGVESK